MTILRLQLTVPPCDGGMEKHVRRLTDQQRRLGCGVKLVFAVGEPKHPDDMLVANGWRIKNIKPQSLRSLVFFAISLKTLWTLRGKFAVLHVHGDWSLALCGKMISWFYGVPLIVSIHGCPGPTKWKVFVQQTALRCADLIHTTGKQDAKRLESALGKPVLWQPSGIDEIFIASCPHENVGYQRGRVAIVSVLREAKNIELAIRIASRMPEVDFVIAGDGPHRKHLERYAGLVGVSNVTFTGSLDVEQVCEVLNQSAAYLCTSFEEGTPTAMMEAMSCGVPVITSACNEFDEIVEEGISGYVVSTFSPEDYVDKLTKTLSGEQWRRMSQAARARAVNFGWPHVAEVITARTVQLVKAGK